MLTSRCSLSAGIIACLSLCGDGLDSTQVPSTFPTTATETLIAEKDAGAPADDEEDIASLDSRRVAWRTPSGKKWTVMLNGDRQAAEFDEVRSLTFSRDSQHLAFAARHDKSWVMVIDAKESPQRFDEVGIPMISKDRARVAYAAKVAKKWTIVVDTTPSALSYDDVGLPTFSEDGAHITYSAWHSPISRTRSGRSGFSQLVTRATVRKDLGAPISARGCPASCSRRPAPRPSGLGPTAPLFPSSPIRDSLEVAS